MIQGLLSKTRSMSRLVSKLDTGCGSKLQSVQSDLISLEAFLIPLRIWFTVLSSKVLHAHQAALQLQW